MLRRTPFRQKTPARQAAGDRSAEFASFEAPRAQARMATGLDKPRPAVLPALLQKTPDRKRPALTDAANGEECAVRIVGACNSRTDTTVAAHFPGLDGGRGMGLKSVDLCIAFACAGCHDVIDMRRPLPPGASRTSVELDYHRGHLRTLVRLVQKGLL